MLAIGICKKKTDPKQVFRSSKRFLMFISTMTNPGFVCSNLRQMVCVTMFGGATAPYITLAVLSFFEMDLGVAPAQPTVQRSHGGST